jgi:hypothetical protein
MSRRSRGWLIGTALTIELGLSTPVAADEMPTVLVYLADEVGISSDILRDAQEEVVQIYALIGVKVIWAKRVTGAPTQLLVVVIPPMTGHSLGPKGALGLALRGSASPGHLAYVFYDRVQEVAEKHQLSNASLLGIAIAHELGHLLLPYGSHSPSGLMQGKWDDMQLERARTGFLRFTTQQADLIRARLTDAQGQAAK